MPNKYKKYNDDWVKSLSVEDKLDPTLHKLIRRRNHLAHPERGSMQGQPYWDTPSLDSGNIDPTYVKQAGVIPASVLQKFNGGDGIKGADAPDIPMTLNKTADMGSQRGPISPNRQRAVVPNNIRTAPQDPYEELNQLKALNKGHDDRRKRVAEARNENGFFGNLVDGAGGMLSGVADYGKKLFNDPARMGLISTGLSMMDPNTYYDKDGFYSTAGGINRALGQGVGTAQTVQGSPAFKRATELMKIQEWNKSGRGQGEFQRLMNERNKLIAQDPNHPDIKSIDDRLEYLVHIKRPTEIDNYEYMDRLPEDKKPSWFANKRSPTTINQGGYTGVLNPADPNRLGASIPKTPPPQDLPAFKEQVAERSAIGKGRGEDIAGALSSLPDMEEEYYTMSNLAEELVNHKGFSSLIGATMFPYARHLHGGDTAGADSIRNQLEGKVFMQAYQTLKGGGQITEIEGRQAKKALARMDISLSEVEYKKALNEFLDAYKRGMEKMRRVSGRSGAMPQRRATDPKSGGLSLEEKKARVKALNKKLGR